MATGFTGREAPANCDKHRVAVYHTPPANGAWFTAEELRDCTPYTFLCIGRKSNKGYKGRPLWHAHCIEHAEVLPDMGKRGHTPLLRAISKALEEATGLHIPPITQDLLLEVDE